MKIRRVAASVSAVVLALGMVSAVSATPSHQVTNQVHETTCGPNHDQPCDSEPPACQNEQGQPIECESTEPSDSASTEPSTDASSEPSKGGVEGRTSAPTLPPTDALSGTKTNGSDSTLPLVLIVLGMIGLSAVVLIPVRTKR